MNDKLAHCVNFDDTRQTHPVFPVRSFGAVGDGVTDDTAAIQAAVTAASEDRMSEHLLLQWGTLKGWTLKSEKSREIMKRYIDLGASMSSMAQHDTLEQKRIICELIDALDGEIQNDWSGEMMSKEAAKQYVNEYRRFANDTRYVSHHRPSHDKTAKNTQIRRMG